MVIILIHLIEQCRAKVYIKLITKLTTKQPLILLITPPLYLSENCLNEAKRNFDYLTFYDIAKGIEHKVTKSILLHLQSPMQLNKETAKLLKNCPIIFAGYTKEGIEYKQLQRINDMKLEEVKGQVDCLNRVDRNLIKIRPDRLELLHKRIDEIFKEMLNQLDNEGVKYEMMEERTEKLIVLRLNKNQQITMSIKEKYEKI